MVPTPETTQVDLVVLPNISFIAKTIKEKKTTPILEANADSGESEKEDIVMDDTKEETKEDSGTIKVCFLISVMHVHADIASLIE